MSSTPDPALAQPTTAKVNKTRAQHINDSYTEANTVLRERYADEFNTARKEYLAKVGITDWSPRLTDEEKAAAEIADLLRKFPDLVEKFRA